MSSEQAPAVTGSRGRVTITQIAREAGVSVPTVSRVVNGRDDVAPQTRTRIEALLEQHGYRRPSRAAERANLIDLVFNDLDSPWAVEIIRGVEDVGHAVGIGTVVSAVHTRADSKRQWLLNVRGRSSDGVILVTSDLEPELEAGLRKLHVPTVVVDPAGVPSMDVPTIGAANWQGGMGATDHLISLGHRRIGLIAGPGRLLCSRARRDGYRAALQASNIEFDERLIHEGDFYHESGFVGATEMLRSDDPPTAIFASSDQMALGVYEAARRLGVRVPEDLSVVGFDDLSVVRWTSPPLTTVRQPLYEMGMLAARTVLRLMDDETVESPRVELATDLVVRDSTAPPRSA
jgi:LacI family transcriptional regulator